MSIGATPNTATPAPVEVVRHLLGIEISLVSGGRFFAVLLGLLQSSVVRPGRTFGRL